MRKGVPAMLNKIALKSLYAVLLFGLCILSSQSYAAPAVFNLNLFESCDGSLDSDCGIVTSTTESCKRNCIITVEATPYSDWAFDHWEGDLSGTSNPTTVRMTSDKNVTAVFVSNSQPPPEPPPNVEHEREVIGYFIQWGIYRRDYLVKDIVDMGAADDLTVINYAFAGIADDLTCTSLDTFADWGKRFDASESVDGVEDTVSQALKGNFNQLKKLKAQYPQIKALISIGGWNDSELFSDAALPQNREKFVSSCVDMFIKGQFSEGITDANVFDGIDVDWEYPGVCGATCNWRAEDRENFTALLEEFRYQMDGIRPGLLLTAALPAATYYHDKIEVDNIATALDWMNVMTYDFHGPWEPNGPTNHHSNLYTNESDPSSPGFSVEGVMNEYISKVQDPSKIVVGLPFYGHGWARVPTGDNLITPGLYQEAGRVPRGTWEKGSEDYKVLKTYGYSEYWDDTAKASYYYNGNNFWTFDSPTAVREKMKFIDDRDLKGVMFWELSGDDGSLIQAISDCLDPLNSACQ
jgi:chitinase